jgi:ribosomal-protein-alanine N-acetyltransferase
MSRNGETRLPAMAPAGPSDATGMAALHAQLFTPAWSARAFADLLAGDGTIAIAVRAGAGFLAGFALARIAADEAEILTIAVAPACQRRGLGGRLLAALLAELQDRGAAKLFLEVAVGNTAARALYARAGFQEAGRRRAYYAHLGGTAEDALILTCALAGGRPGNPTQS